MSAKFVQLLKGTGEKKFKAVFYDAARKKIKSTSFGAKGYQDYTQHQDMTRQQSYLARHKTTEDWDDYMSAGSLSRYILWSKPTLSGAYKAYRQRFGLELY
jgi:hypothetical protein